MLSGVKFISRDQVEKSGDVDGSRKESRESNNKKEKSRRKKKNSRCSSSDDEHVEKIKKGSKKSKWYSSDEYSTSSSADDESDYDAEERHHGSSRAHEVSRSKKKSKRSKRKYSSKYDSSYSSEGEEDGRGKKKRKNADGAEDPSSADGIDIVRKEMGLDWMLKPAERANRNVEPTYEQQSAELPSEEKVNPKELNPYLRNSGSGYPEDVDQTKTKNDQLMSSSLVGDGGASWRLKALKRAEEQAVREGRNLEEVVQERWGSLGHLAVSVASRSPAAPRAHLRAIKSRKMGSQEEKSDSNNPSERDTETGSGREYLKDVSVRHPEMRAPKVRDSLSWGRRKGQKMHQKDSELVSKAVSSINKFANDGNFLNKFTSEHEKVESSSHDVPRLERDQESDSHPAEKRIGEEQQPLSANQLAAKAMQLRLKGKHEEAEKLLKEAEKVRAEQDKGERLMKIRNDISASRYVAQDIKMRQKGKEDDSDVHLAQSIAKNKQYNMFTQADDEYDYDGAPAKKSRRKRGEHDNISDGRQNVAKRIITQKERCVFCFENPKRPKHLVVSIANFTYLMLPQYQPVAPGHCCIVTLQHESATRMVDDNVLEEIRNFKKCLIMMFAKQDKEMIFLETVMGLAQQRRHCLIECIPLPQDIAKEAPLYFKKAIDEAEDEWSQHNAKKLIDTSQKKGLHSSIPENFPYFHVEFGLNRGFVHVIDDESQFKSSLGLNVIRGMLQSQDEDMYRRRRYESIEVQTQAVASFARDWEPFDWTKQLD